MKKQAHFFVDVQCRFITLDSIYSFSVDFCRAFTSDRILFWAVIFYGILKSVDLFLHVLLAFQEAEKTCFISLYIEIESSRDFSLLDD